MRNLTTLATVLAASLAVTAPAFAQQYGYVEYGTAPTYGYAPSYSLAPAYTYGASPLQRGLEHGRFTATDLGPGVVTFGRARPDPVVGNNTSRGTDNKGTVDPPSRDRDVIDAFKKVD